MELHIPETSQLEVTCFSPKSNTVQMFVCFFWFFLLTSSWDIYMKRLSHQSERGLQRKDDPVSPVLFIN